MVQPQTRAGKTQTVAFLRDLGQVTSSLWASVSLGAGSVTGRHQLRDLLEGMLGENMRDWEVWSAQGV